MIQLMAVMVPLVFLINGLTKHDWKSAFFFAMAVAVGLTPEMLPMIVSVCLAKGALAMSRKKVIVKRLNAIQNFGGMDVLCTDKTGTLTEDRVVLQRHCDVAGRETDEVLLDGYLISHFQTGLKNLLDAAILDSPDFHQQDAHREVQEARRDPLRLHAAHDVGDGGRPRRPRNPADQGRSGRDISAVLAVRVGRQALADGPRADRQGSEGGVREPQQRRLPRSGRGDEGACRGSRACSKDDERDLVLKGYVAFLDPPKTDRGDAPSARCTSTAWRSRS